MSKMTFKEIKETADAIYSEYDARFAGKPRATRDLGVLDELIGRLNGLVEQGQGLLNGSRDPALLSVLDMASNNLEVYRTERAAIEEAKAAGPASEAAGNLATRANLIFGQYYRHFAGKDRKTRDIGFLGELIDELTAVRDEMKALQASGAADEVAQNLRIVEDNLRMYTNERDLIIQTRQQLDTAEHADALAFLANGQFKLYRDHFAGLSRTSRRPALLERMIAQLENIRMNMKRLQKQGFVSPAHKRNIGIVRDNLNLYRNELIHIKEAQDQLSSLDLAGHLGRAANDVMAEYRDNYAGKDRATRDLELLSVLCDRLAEVARMMRALDARAPSDVNTRNLGIVLDTWALYETEYQRIEEAKAAG